MNKTIMSEEFDSRADRSGFGKKEAADRCKGYGSFKHDFSRYRTLMSRKTPIHTVRLWMYTPGLWILLSYRIGRSLNHAWGGSWILKPLRAVCAFFHFLLGIVVGIEIPLEAEIDEGLYIGHHGGIIISPKAVMGKNCNISQGVTIGEGGRGDDRGVPVVGDRVYIGPGAKLFGAITIGDDVAIGANAVVDSSLPANAVAGGVPAKILSNRGSKDFVIIEKRLD